MVALRPCSFYWKYHTTPWLGSSHLSHFGCFILFVFNNYWEQDCATGPPVKTSNLQESQNVFLMILKCIFTCWKKLLQGFGIARSVQYSFV